MNSRRYYGIIQHAARSLQASLTPSDTADQPESFKRQRSSTPEVPKTPPFQLASQLSNASILSTSLSESGDTGFIFTGQNQIRNQTLRPDPSTPITTTTNADADANANALSRSTPLFASVTPLHNNYMTVPIGFTPKTPKSCMRTRRDAESVLLGGDLTPGPKLVQRKRQLEDLEEEKEEEIGESKKDKTTLFSDKKKKMRT